jgi:TonB family protein
VLICCALLFIFNIVPEGSLPRRIYSVKILQPIVRSNRKAEADKPVAVEKKKETKPAPAKPKKKAKKKEEPVKQEAPKEKPMDLSVDQQVPEQTSLVVDAPRFPFSYYLEAIERKVSQNWFAGSSGVGDGVSCVVYFRLQRNGRVSDVRIERASGSSYFDRSALRAVRSASPFPPLPKAFNDAYLGIHFTFVQRD